MSHECKASELTAAPEDDKWWLREDGLRHCANPKCRAEIRECMGSVVGRDLMPLWEWNKNPIGHPPPVRELCFWCARSCDWTI